MMLLFRLAWRNIFRNTRRTILAGLAVGMGLAAMIFSDGLILGMEKVMIDQSTETLLGHGQIHSRAYRESPDVEAVIPNYTALLSRVKKDPQISHASARAISYAMVTSPSGAETVLLYGIDPPNEAKVSKLKEVVIQGSYSALEEQSAVPKIIIGKGLAEKLEVELDDRIVLTASQAGTGDLSQELFRLGGIFSFGIRELDNSVVFVSLKRAQHLLALKGKAHEIVFQFTDVKYSRDKNNRFWKRFSDTQVVAESWMEIMPELESLLQLTQISMFILAFILFGIVSFGIMNTLFMSLYERMFEFGILRAIGTRPSRLGVMIVLEAAAVCVISIVIGVILGYALLWLFSFIGIDYRGVEYGGITFRDKLYPIIRMYPFFLYPVWLLIFTMLIGLYPAIYAAKIKPAKALRRSY